MIVKGQKINDRYEILKLIGEGGMANVYLASDTILDRQVAIKVLRGDLSNDDKEYTLYDRTVFNPILSTPELLISHEIHSPFNEDWRADFS